MISFVGRSIQNLGLIPLLCIFIMFPQIIENQLLLTYDVFKKAHQVEGPNAIDL